MLSRDSIILHAFYEPNEEKCRLTTNQSVFKMPTKWRKDDVMCVTLIHVTFMQPAFTLYNSKLPILQPDFYQDLLLNEYLFAYLFTYLLWSQVVFRQCRTSRMRIWCVTMATGRRCSLVTTWDGLDRVLRRSRLSFPTTDATLTNWVTGCWTTGLCYGKFAACDVAC